MDPICTSIPYSYSKRDTPLSVLRLDDLPLDKTQILDQQIASFGPNGKGGNHTHSRIEWMIGFGSGLQLYWLDDKGDKH